MESVSCVIVKRFSPSLQSSHSLFCAVWVSYCSSLKTMNKSFKPQIFHFMTWIWYLSLTRSCHPPSLVAEGAHKTLNVSSPETQTRLCKSPQHFLFLSPLQDHLLSPPKFCLSTTWVALFSLKYPPFPSLFSFLSHPLIPALPSSQHRAVNRRQWQTPTRKPAILIPLCISIMEQLDMRALLSGPSWLTACCIPSVNRERGKEVGRHKGEKEGGKWLWFGYHSNGINGCVGFKLALDDSGGLTVFLSVIGRFPPITQSLSLCLSPLPLLFLRLPIAAIYS